MATGIEDAGRLKNRIRLLSIVVAAGVWLSVSITTRGLALAVLVPCAVVAWVVSGREIQRMRSTANVFRKSYPLNAYGATYGHFEHVFHHRRSLESDILETVIRELRKRTPVQSIEPLTVTDADPELDAPEERLFLRADAGRTERGTTVTLVLQIGRFGSMQSVRWWVLGGGYIDRNKRFNFVAYAGLSLWFWIVPYLKREHDPLPALRTVHPGGYNGMDLTTRVRCLHEAVFSAMVAELERHEIDTSDLRAQRAQVMNITVSGGKLVVGNVVQGARNQLAAKIKDAKEPSI